MTREEIGCAGLAWRSRASAPATCGCGHRGALVGRPRVVRDRGGDRGARGEEVEEGAPVAVAGNRVVVVRGADGDGGRDAGRGADGGDVAVVAGRDHGRHALRQEGVDAALAHVPVARGAVDPAAEAHVRGDDAPLRVRGVEGRQLVERAELVGGVGRDAGGRPAAGGGGVEAGEDLHRDDPRARSDSRYGAAGCPGAETGRDARDMGAVVAEVDRAARAAGERVDVGAVVLGRAVGAQRLLAGGKGRRRAVLRDDAAAEERVVDVDPGVEDRDRAAGAGEAARWASSARMTASVLSRARRSGRSTCTARTCGASRSRSSEAAGTVATRWGERRMVRVTSPTRRTASATDRVLASAS